MSFDARVARFEAIAAVQFETAKVSAQIEKTKLDAWIKKAEIDEKLLRDLLKIVPLTFDFLLQREKIKQRAKAPFKRFKQY